MCTAEASWKLSLRDDPAWEQFRRCTAKWSIPQGSIVLSTSKNSGFHHNLDNPFQLEFHLEHDLGILLACDDPKYMDLQGQWVQTPICRNHADTIDDTHSNWDWVDIEVRISPEPVDAHGQPIIEERGFFTQRILYYSTNGGTKYLIWPDFNLEERFEQWADVRESKDDLDWIRIPEVRIILKWNGVTYTSLTGPGGQYFPVKYIIEFPIWRMQNVMNKLHTCNNIIMN